MIFCSFFFSYILHLSVTLLSEFPNFLSNKQIVWDVERPQQYFQSQWDCWHFSHCSSEQQTMNQTFVWKSVYISFSVVCADACTASFFFYVEKGNQNGLSRRIGKQIFPYRHFYHLIRGKGFNNNNSKNIVAFTTKNNLLPQWMHLTYSQYGPQVHFDAMLCAYLICPFVLLKYIKFLKRYQTFAFYSLHVQCTHYHLLVPTHNTKPSLLLYVKKTFLFLLGTTIGSITKDAIAFFECLCLSFSSRFFCSFFKCLRMRLMLDSSVCSFNVLFPHFPFNGWCLFVTF